MKVRRVDYYPDEYIVGVSRMSYEAQGVYWMICSLIMSHGGPIPNDPKWIGNLGGMGSAKCRNLIADLVAGGKLTENGGKIGQKRAENELKNAQKRIETARENGQKGGRPPSGPNDLAEPGGLSGEKLTTNYQLPTTNQQEEDSPSICPPSEPEEPEATPPTLASGEARALSPKDRWPSKSKLPRRGGHIAYPDEFEAAWSAYPVRDEDKTAKGDCYTNWRKATVDDRVAPETIVEGAQAWAFVTARQDMRIGFRRWLREALWNHPPPKPNTSQRKSIIEMTNEANARDRRGEAFDPFGPIEDSAYVGTTIEHRALPEVPCDVEDGWPQGSADRRGGSDGSDRAVCADVVPLFAPGSARRMS